MALAFRASALSGSDASPRTVAKPTGTIEGDALLLHVVLSDDVAPTVPAGFTLIPSAEITGTSNCRVYLKMAGASEPANYEVSFASGTGQTGMMAVSAADVVTGHAVAVRTNASGDRVWDEVTNTVENTFLCCFGSFASNLTSSPDGAMTERYDLGGTPRIYLMTQSIAATGATGTRTATGTSLASKCVTVSLAEGEIPLAAPTDLVATAISGTEIDLTWNDGGVLLDGISIERSPGGAETWVEIDTVAAGVEAYSDSGLDTGTTYDYRIRAFTL